MRLRARHYRTGQLLDIHCEHGKIARFDPSATTDPDAPWVAPAFCDVQINGCDGISFNSDTLTTDEIRHVVDVCRHHGIAQLMPTLVTGPFAALMHGFRAIRMACAEDAELAQAIVGVHLEGPYLSPEDGPRGAHPKEHIRPPDWDEFQRFQNEAAHGMIRMVTSAPETPGAVAFIDKVAHTGVVAALGHTAAVGECIRDAIRAGARISTHLGNGSHAMLPRHENYLWEQLAEDRLWASMIADGHHLPATVMRCMLRVKTPARMILTCDASPLAGAPPGIYRMWDTDFEVISPSPPTPLPHKGEGSGCKIVVSGTSYLGGSWAFTDSCVANVLALGETSLADTIDMASNQPRKLLRLPPRRIEVGEPAELIVFDWSPERAFRLTATVAGDTLVNVN
jgi:N-acetylglucosamine-6-phosphate deacetylase